MDQFRDAIERRDPDALAALMTDDVVFRSPVVHTPYCGRGSVTPLFAAVFDVLEDVRYARRIGDPGAANQALVLHARVGDREVEACDFIHLTDEGLIDEFYVMVRPLSGLRALADAMTRRLGLADPPRQAAA
jgi:hypothetical protein